LLVKGILHRDISFNNLLLSSNPDTNGVLIDFDMAKRMKDIIANQGTEGDSRTVCEFRLGLGCFVSYSIYRAPELSSQLRFFLNPKN
jgi:serine/threonine protein kinase